MEQKGCPSPNILKDYSEKTQSFSYDPLTDIFVLQNDTTSPVKNELDDNVIVINDSPVKITEKPQKITEEPQQSVETASDVRFIGGVKVEFPVKPYAAQIAVMDKVIKGISKRQNCLLESPTGSGKTLALLCASLAWQKKRKEEVSGKIKAFEREKSKVKVIETPAPSKFSPENTIKPSKFTYLDSEDEEDVFKTPVAKKRQETSPINNEEPLVNIHKKQKLSPSVSQQPTESQSNLEQNLEETSCEEDLSIPKIYFGTRTHKQIEQVIKELKRTVYAKNLKMSILSSREHTCIKELLPSYKSKLEMCRDLLDKANINKNEGQKKCTGCKYFDNKHILVGSKRPKEVWDIEELMSLGRKYSSCAYFAARDLADFAEIVFCPYNYIIDPLIRNTIQINVENSIILLDEAHNIEDVCRDAASLTLDRNNIKDALTDIESLVGLKQEIVNHNISDLYSLKKWLLIWHDWFENHEPLIQKKSDFESSYTFNGSELAKSFQSHGIGFEDFPKFLDLVNETLYRLKEKYEPKNENMLLSKKCISSTTGAILESMSIIFSYFFRDNCKNLNDYTGILLKKEGRQYKTERGWLSKQTQTSHTLTLTMNCLNPAVVFEMIEKNARCIILSSGTLTPTLTFSTELGVSFPIELHTNHVIKPHQVWVGSIDSGPNDVKMEGTFLNTSKPEWQDALGKILLWVCETVPHGVLCFFSSYRLVETLTKRWHDTGIWYEIANYKSIFVESKNMKDHNEIMTDFYSCVGDNQGALLIAVYRGKVSEGMDFKDHQARAVVAVGIPYPNVRDSLIHNKMKYNESLKIHRGLLPGSEWLQVQAYRALNQALGRCVRHQNDWGAVLMIDSRFANPLYTKHVSKWIKNFLGNRHHTWESFTSGPDNLKKFMDRMSI